MNILYDYIYRWQSAKPEEKEKEPECVYRW